MRESVCVGVRVAEKGRKKEKKRASRTPVEIYIYYSIRTTTTLLHTHTQFFTAFCNIQKLITTIV